MLVLVAAVGLVIVAATDQIAPATSERVAQLRIWLVARASGITAYLLLTAQVVLGLLLSVESDASSRSRRSPISRQPAASHASR
jgi:nitrate reductase gamma subunit